MATTGLDFSYGEWAQAKKYHSLSFFYLPSNSLKHNWVPSSLGSFCFNTWVDFKLVPTSRPVIAMPKLRTHYVTIPGKEGILDLTDYFGNDSYSNDYDNVTGSLTFLDLGEYKESHVAWANKMYLLAEYIDGRVLQMVLNDYPYNYYGGRWYIEEWSNNNDGTCNTVTFSYDLHPWPKRVT